MFQHCGQKIEVARQRRNGVLLGSITTIQRVERVNVVHLIHKQGAKARVTGIKVDEQGAVLHIRKLDGQIGRHRGFALAAGGAGHIEAVVLLLGAQTVAQDICRRRVILQHIGTVRAGGRQHRALPAAEEQFVLRNNADGFQTKHRFRIARVGQRRADDQLHQRNADATAKAQHREQNG